MAIAVYPVCRRTAKKEFVRTARRVEKMRARAHFNGEYEAPYEPQCRTLPYTGGRAAYQTGTIPDAFFWDGPRLSSVFAAQVIGQALAAQISAGSALGTYGRPRLRPVASLDERV